MGLVSSNVPAAVSTVASCRPAAVQLGHVMIILLSIKAFQSDASTWGCRYYSFHYAPLISDLAKFATGGKRSKVTIGGEVMSLDDDSWAPANGPVRPLVQLMAVLPLERCGHGSRLNT